MTVTYPFDASENLDTPQAVQEYLAAAFETEDPTFIADALGVIAKAFGMTRLAQDTGLSRPELYKTLNSDGKRYSVIGLLAVALFILLAGRSYTNFYKQDSHVQNGENLKYSSQRYSSSTLRLAAYQPSCSNPQTRDDANYCEQREATIASKKQASWAFYQLIVSAIGIFLVLPTLIYTARAANAAKSAAEAIPLLERAYPYIVIKDHNISRTLELAAQASTPFPQDAKGAVDFSVKNYGKTPLTIINLTAEVHVTRPEPYARNIRDNFIPHEVMIGDGQESETFHAVMSEQMLANDFFAVVRASERIYFSGWCVYRDIWRQKHTLQFGWYYDPFWKRWVTLDQDGKGGFAEG